MIGTMFFPAWAWVKRLEYRFLYAKPQSTVAVVPDGGKERRRSQEPDPVAIQDYLGDHAKRLKDLIINIPPAAPSP